MDILKDIVLPNGFLDDKRVMKREILYKGMNGREIERFFVNPSQSFVFKPLTNNSQMGKENWIYENVLSAFPPFYPRILAKSLNSHNPNHNWIIYDDLGPLNHDFNEETAKGVVTYMAGWHRLSIDKLVHAPLKGPKPFIEEIALEVLRKKGEIERIQSDFDISNKLIDTVYSLLQKENFSKELVLSHGDLHLGNYAVSHGRIYIFDWEHTHLNSRFWDLFHLIDLSHPVFPKKLTSRIREELLDLYLIEMEPYGIKLDKSSFKREYYLFSSVFNLWMLLLIERDLKKDAGIWSKGQLENQLNETILSLRDCAYHL
ncbi:phosphotransferase family protein [Cytobacillus sp. FJAT-54145]|uniref:Phosphotransferase family protein n=1 Tax=Cytobacillus spartinae TaxID=3299023 RepID=A0ABW6KCL2_9BACI